MRRSILGFGLLVVSVAGAQPAGRPFALDDVARMRVVSDPQISPDGERVAYVVEKADLSEDENESDLWMTSWDGRETVRLTSSDGSESSPRWSPDGRFLAFLSERGNDADIAQLWLLPLGGGEAEKLTDSKGAIEDFDWSPDGKRFVLEVADPEDAPPSRETGSGRKKAKKPVVIDRFQFKQDRHGYLGARRNHLVLLDRETRKTEPLTTGNYDERMPVWSPDGKWIAFSTKRGADPDRTDNWDLYAVEPRAGATPRPLTTFEGADNDPGWESRPAWSPDGKWLAYVQGGPDKLIYYAVHRLAVVPAAGGEARILTADLDRNVGSPRFSDGGAAILFTVEDDQAIHLAKIPAAGGAVQRLVTGRRVVPSFSAAGNGRISILSGTASQPNEVFAAGAGEPRRLSHQNDEWLSQVRFGSVEQTRFPSKDGTEIHGFLFSPPDVAAGRRYPAVLRIHGGPVGQFENAFDEELHWFAANGYVVIAANPRGSSGRGEKFQSAIYADWGHRDTEDVLAAVDDAVRRGIADPDRLAVGGWSYGGMLTNYVIASTTRFRAATSGAGISNIFTGYGTDQYVREYEQELGAPWKNRDAWLQVSYPFFHADRIRTPTLFLCGEIDSNVPLINSEQMYQALRSLGVPTQLVIYPDQYHGIEKPSYVRDRLERYLAWYDRYTGPGKAAAPGAAAASP